ncbi:hypothetical protein GOP47_0029933 [Adiantum capillus-veneris]|nr:hypothetical protein GOP47_0029933 [Adiantum capillus-veneris]
MSWLRSAISKAAEVGGKNIGPNLSRTVRSVAQHAGQAVAGGAKIVQDRLVGRNLNSSKIAIKRLDEVAKSVRGDERIQALARWLGALKELGKDHKPITMEEIRSIDGTESPVSNSQEELPSPRSASKVLFYDGDGEPMNFREVFLRSHALENIVISMILEAPVEEEVNLLLEIFGLCLTGGQELHVAIMSSIQDLAKAFSTYDEEFMSKREYLLQYARDAVIGLKLNADLERLETEIAPLMHSIMEKRSVDLTKEDGLIRTREILQLDIHLRDLLQRKKRLMLTGDTKESRSEKVELLNSLSTSLRQSALEAEKQIDENRSQKEEALKYRAIKAQEVSDLEKGVAIEVKTLQQKRDELEAQLKEVNISLAVALKRHLNLQEEKEKFDEASSGIMAHLAAEEELLTRSITGQNTEANVLGTWVSFLKDTWELQSSCTQQEDKDTLDAMGGLKEQFLQTLLVNLKYLQDELSLFLGEMKSCSKSLVSAAETESGTEVVKERRMLEQRYFEVEGQIVSILRTVEVLKEEADSFAALETGVKYDVGDKVAEAFVLIEQLRKEVEAVERPEVLYQGESESKTPKSSPKSKPSLRWADPVAQSEREAMQPEDFFEEESRREMLERGANPDKSKGNNVDVGSHDETEGWEFDEIEEELKG